MKHALLPEDVIDNRKSRWLGGTVLNFRDRELQPGSMKEDN